MTDWIGVIIAFFSLIISFAVPIVILRKEYKNNVRLQLFEKRTEVLDKAISISCLTDRLRKEKNRIDKLDYYEIIPSEVFFQVYTNDWLDYQQIYISKRNDIKSICNYLYSEKVNSENLRAQCSYLFPEVDAQRLIKLFVSYIDFVSSLSEACRIRENSYKSYLDTSEEEKIQAFEVYKKSVVIPFNEMVKKSDKLLNKINKTNIDEVTKSYQLFSKPAYKHRLAHKK